MILVECPRDAIQGLKKFIPTEKKINYLNVLIASNLFDWIDFGSFVSPKAIPQMTDTKEVVKNLNLNGSKSKLLAIVLNERGARDAADEEKISYLGYPFSVSETFQNRNANSTLSASFENVKLIKKICDEAKKELVIYISMAFGNPYGDIWSYALVIDWLEKLKNIGITQFSLADTTGQALRSDIENLFRKCSEKFPDITIGAHFHSTADSWLEKVQSAYNVGCRKFDGAILGYGGCPMAQNDLVGNVPMEGILKTYKNTNTEAIEELKKAFLILIR